MENQKGIALSKVSPSFLNANSTSHTWAFSAIAEIIDNAYDPDVNASELWIDKMEEGGKTCLTFTDNGAGLNADRLLKMLSFGFCEKAKYESKTGHKPIGHYGNGFKSGSMRIAKDVLVFTRHLKEMSVGMLSQTFLSKTKAETVVVPLVTWNSITKKRSESAETVNNIEAITSFSSFNTEERLLAELEELSDLQTGTRIILYNLKADSTGKLELDFESDPTDILNPQTLEIDLTSVYRPVQETLPMYCISLREYCSILFLKPRMKIVLRGKKVKTKLICKSLSQTETDRYKPHWLDKPLKITYGFTCSESSNEEYGIMMYHKNRLIKAFEKVGYQKQPNDLGVGVVGVVEVNFLQPIHNKQDFNKDERYNTFMSALAIKTNEYWNEKKSGSNSVSTNLGANPDWLWAQCDNCLKWRRLPDGINRQLPDKWYCYMNPDASHNRCEIIEEPEDEDLSLQHASYQKTFKREMEQQKRKTRVEGHQMLIKKEKELIEKEEKLKQRVKTVEQICTEVTSTQIQERKKTEGLRRMLLDAKKREANQRKLILELQMKKSQVNKNQKELCKAAESLRVSNFETTALLEDASELTDGPTVSSTSGMKRKSVSNDITVSKRLIIKEEDTDEVVAVIPDSDEVIDLTEEDEQIIIPDPKLVQKNQLMEDIKPNIEELEAQVGTSQREVSTGEIETQTDLDLEDSDINPSKNKTSIEKPNKDLEVTKIELEDTKLKLEDANKRLKDLQNNVHSLLSIIVPGVDLGEATEIETIVTEMIRVNQESS